jgi:Fe(3+) dicitrate transport protein
VGAQYADSFNTVAVDATGRIGVIPAYDIIDVNVRYKHAATGLIGIVSVKSLTDSTYVASRRPDGTFLGAFRQITAGLRWESP